MAAIATFRPWILLHDVERLDHEMLHVDDVRRFAEAYINELEQNSFETAAQCQSEAGLLMDDFGKTMQRFARRSNLERHPSLRR